MQPIRHVVFHPSAAVDLRKAVARAGRDDDVIAFFDDFSFGPINPPDPEVRRQWVEAELGYSGWGPPDLDTETFWKASLATEVRLIAWTSRRSARDYSNFLEWLWRLDDLPCEIVDLTDVPIRGHAPNRLKLPPRLVTSPAAVRADEFIANGLLDRAERLTKPARDHHRHVWLRLREEDAALRILNGSKLESAPVAYFDDLLLSFAAKDWHKAARIVGETMSKFWSDSLEPVGDIVLAARLRALVQVGKLESQGNLQHIRFSEVRLPRG